MKLLLKTGFKSALAIFLVAWTAFAVNSQAVSGATRKTGKDPQAVSGATKKSGKDAKSVKTDAVAQIQFDPPEWKFGMLEYGAKVAINLKVTNSGTKKIQLAMIEDCDCLKVSPSKVVIPAGGSVVLHLKYSTEYDEGIVKKSYSLWWTPDDINLQAKYMVTGVVWKSNEHKEDKDSKEDD